MLLVDLRQNQIIEDAIYVIRLEDRFMAKRIQHRIDGSVLIKSDNPAYSDENVSKPDIPLLHIIGRAVWVGSMIKQKLLCFGSPSRNRSKGYMYEEN